MEEKKEEKRSERRGENRNKSKKEQESGKENGKLAKEDYYREMEEIKEGRVACWDDTRWNRAEVGDYFAFVIQNEDKMEIFEIVGTDGKNKRRNTWKIEENSERKVLELSRKIGTMSFKDYKEMNGYMKKENGKWKLELEYTKENMEKIMKVKGKMKNVPQLVEAYESWIEEYESKKCKHILKNGKRKGQKCEILERKDHEEEILVRMDTVTIHELAIKYWNNWDDCVTLNYVDDIVVTTDKTLIQEVREKDRICVERKNKGIEKEMNSRRRKKMCDYEIQKGARKGQVCGVKSREGKKCAKHRDKKENVYGRMPMEIVRIIMKYVEVRDDAAKVINLEKQLGMELKRGKVEGKEYRGGNEKCDGRKSMVLSEEKNVRESP
ncbi:hypothetical protein DFJ73DRAFT_765218 [Zopfochytrium polystomum]|nr:hypothetical protein DFJ73DRAFT_765218 [Zopfochytrium polystomum]